MTYLKQFSAMAAGVVLVCVMSPMGSDPRAQGTITVGFPTRLAAAPDYATDVLGDPWDMCNPEDMSLRPDERVGFSSFSFLQGPCRAAERPWPTARTIRVDDDAAGHTTWLSILVVTAEISLSIRASIKCCHKVYRRMEDPQSTGCTSSNTRPGWSVGGRPRTLPGRNDDCRSDAITSLVSPWTSGVVRGLRLDPNSFNPVEMCSSTVRLTPAAARLSPQSRRLPD
jgi:hypothetical protein